MALNRQRTAPPPFEVETDNEASQTATVEVQTPEAPAAEAAAKVSASTAIAKAAGSALSTNVRKITNPLAPLRNAMPAIEFGVLSRLVASAGVLQDGDKAKFGTWVRLQVISVNELWVITPSVDTDAAKKLVRYSRDGRVIDDTGEDVNKYLDSLRADGYDKAAKKEYYELTAIVLEADKPHPAAISQDMVLVSLSPQSRKSWQNYELQCMQRSFKDPTADAEAFAVCYAKAEAASMNGKDFTKLVFSQTKP